MSMKTPFTLLSTLLALWFAISSPSLAVPLDDAQTGVATMRPPQPGWFFIHSSGQMQGTTIFDAQTGVMQGMVDTSRNADLAIDPKGRRYYVSETIWSLGNRGIKQNLVAIYDSASLKLLTQIKIPGRMAMIGRKHNFVLSADGTTGFIFDMTPATSVNVIDLVHDRFVKNIEMPGCATLIPNKTVGFSALCSDGSMATVDARLGKISRSPAFFSATGDPIFDNYNYDEASETAVFVSYTGLITTAHMGAAPTISEPFSLQAAAGYRPATTKPLDLAYYPGGDQPSAWHAASGRLFVLVHPGEYWSHTSPGTQLWVLDLAARKVVKRIPLGEPVTRVEVTQGPKPLLYLTRSPTAGIIMDPDSGEKLHDINQAGGGVVSTFTP